MGCVYSEVATWVTEGSAKLLEYRRRRQNEIAQKLGVSSTEEDRFHHFSELLETVRGIHAEIGDNCRRCDLFTPCVIEKLVKGMVRSKALSRGTAQFLLEESAEILRDAKGKQKEAMPSVPAPNPDHTIADSAIDVRKRRASPSLPPEQGFTPLLQSIETSSSISNQEGAATLRRPRASHAQADYHYWQQRTAPKPDELGPRRRSQGVRKDPPFNDPESQREESGTSRTLLRVMSQPTLPHMHSQYGPGSFNAGPALVPFQPRDNIVMPIKEASAQSREQANVLEHSHSDSPGRSQPATSWTQTYAPNSHPESRLASVPKPNPTSQHPTMTVSEGLRLIKEKRWKFVKYPDEDEILKKRDHV